MTRALESCRFQKYKNLEKSPKYLFEKKIRKKRFCQTKKCYPLCFSILRGRNSTRALQSSRFQKYKNLKKTQKIFFFQQKKIKKKKFAKQKKFFPLSFSIIRGRDSTRALQSSRFQKYKSLEKSHFYIFFKTFP